MGSEWHSCFHARSAGVALKRLVDRQCEFGVGVVATGRDVSLSVVGRRAANVVYEFGDIAARLHLSPVIPTTSRTGKGSVVLTESPPSSRDLIFYGMNDVNEHRKAEWVVAW